MTTRVTERDNQQPRLFRRGTKKQNTMKTLEELDRDSTYMVTDNEANRFNFFGLIQVTPELVEIGKHAIEWDLTEDIPEDVQKALDVMEENNVVMDDFAGIVTFDYDDDTYYLLTW